MTTYTPPVGQLVQQIFHMYLSYNLKIFKPQDKSFQISNRKVNVLTRMAQKGIETSS